MKQCVKIKLTSSGNTDVRIRSVSQVGDKLIAISEIFRDQSAFCNDSINSIVDHVIVPIPTEQPLPVIHYLTSEQGKESAEFYCKAQAFYGEYGGIDTACTPIANPDELPKEHQGGIKRFVLPANNRRDFRLERSLTRANTTLVSADKLPENSFAPENVQAILNIYPIVADGYIQFMLETMGEEDSYYYSSSLFYDLKSCTYSCNVSKEFLEEKAMLRCDNDLHLSATFNKKIIEYKTQGAEFTLPENAEDFFELTQFIDSFLEKFRSKGMVIVSQDSILVHFDDCYISNIGGMHIIENDLPISVETFLKLPGTIVDPKSITEYFMQWVCNNESLPRYEKLRAELAKNTTKFSVAESGLFSATQTVPSEPTESIAYQPG